jgi:hypothetical protein
VSPKLGKPAPGYVWDTIEGAYVPSKDSARALELAREVAKLRVVLKQVKDAFEWWDCHWCGPDELKSAALNAVDAVLKESP